MTDDFRQRVEAAKDHTSSVSPKDAQQQLEQNPDALLIETRLRENVPLSEHAENVVFISVDEQASDDSRQKLDPRLLDPNRQIITT